MTPEEGQQPEEITTKFTTFYRYFKLLSMMLLIYSEYLFFSSPNYLNETIVLSRMYPYAAFFGTHLLAMTYISFLWNVPNCDIPSWLTNEVLSSFILFVVMILVCTLKLSYCETPEISFLLPEIIGLSVSLLSLQQAVSWLFRFYPAVSDNH